MSVPNLQLLSEFRFDEVSIPSCVSCLIRCPNCLKQYHINSGTESMQCVKCGQRFTIKLMEQV